MPEEIVDSDALQVLHARGNPKFGTIIRYSGSLIGRNETPRWASKLIRQWPGDTVLITPRTKGYFAADDMRPVLAKLADLPRPIVCSGSSMGGYGALKYSRQLGAETVLAFAPQFSVSPHEAPFDPERHAFHQPDRHGDMAIRAEDVAGNVAIFFDPRVPADLAHADAIRRGIQAAVPVAMVPVTYSTHVVVTLMDSKSKLRTSVRLARRGDAPGLRRYYRQIKRETPRYPIELAVAAAVRGHSNWAEAIVRDAAEKFGWTRSIHLAHARVLSARGDDQAAHAAAEAGIRAHTHPPAAAQSILAGAMARDAGQRDLALAHFRAARDNDPFRPPHHVAYAEALMHYGLGAEAIEVLRQASAKFPGDRKIGRHLAEWTGGSRAAKLPLLISRLKWRARALLRGNRGFRWLYRTLAARRPDLARRLHQFF